MRVMLALLLLPLLGAPLFAQDEPEDIAKELEALKNRVNQLETKLNEQKLDDAKADKAKSERDKVALTLKYSNGFKMESKDKRFKLQVKGRLMFDTYGHFKRSDELNEEVGGVRKRRIRLRVDGTLYKYWKFRITGQYETEDVTATDDMWIENSYLGSVAKLRVGQTKPAMSLEHRISSKYLPFVERSAIANIVNDSYEVGWMVHGALLDGKLAYSAMVHNGAGTAREDGERGKFFNGHVRLQPFKGTESALAGFHVGASGTIGRADELDPSTSAQHRLRTSARTTVIRYASTVLLDGEVQAGGIDAGLLVGPLKLYGEFLVLRHDVAIDTTGSDSFGIDLGLTEEVEWQGFSAAICYMLTGEKQTWGRVIPTKIMEPGYEDGYGAWEIVARYDRAWHDQGKDSSLFRTPADEMQQVVAGINWYPHPMARISLQYIHAWWNEPAPSSVIDKLIISELPPREQTLMLRVQLEF